MASARTRGRLDEAPKRLQLLRELIPNAARFGVLVNPEFPATQSIVADPLAAARTLSLRCQSPSAPQPRPAGIPPTTTIEGDDPAVIHIGDTDQNGLTSTSTRTIVVEAPSIVLAAIASTSQATSTAPKISPPRHDDDKPGTRFRSVPSEPNAAMLYFFYAGAWETTMQGEHDIWNTAEVHRAIRRRIGEALSAGYDLSKPLPDRMQTLLEQLDEPSAHPLRPPGRAYTHIAQILI
jgi:hypothetical protein